MRPAVVLAHEFVEYIPEELRERTLYVSIAFAIVAHKCCCGCGREVVTPLSPTDWKLIFDGETISLFPSIGNWSYPCRAHYWIRRNRAEWARPLSREQIDAGRAADVLAKAAYYGSDTAEAELTPAVAVTPTPGATPSADGPGAASPKESVWQRLRRWLFGASTK